MSHICTQAKKKKDKMSNILFSNVINKWVRYKCPVMSNHGRWQQLSSMFYFNKTDSMVELHFFFNFYKKAC